MKNKAVSNVVYEFDVTELEILKSCLGKTLREYSEQLSSCDDKLAQLDSIPENERASDHDDHRKGLCEKIEKINQQKKDARNLKNVINDMHQLASKSNGSRFLLLQVGNHQKK